MTQIDRPDAFWGSIIPIQTGRLRATRELLEAAVQFAVFVEMRFKHELACWRPTDYSAQVQPMITTPGHGSLPSGHATQAYVTYEVLKALLNSRQHGEGFTSLNLQLNRTAARIATNRVIAGVHFPVDSVAGRMLGTVVGEIFVHCCGDSELLSDELNSKTKKLTKVAWRQRRFNGPVFPAGEDFDPMRQSLITEHGKPPPYYEVEPVWASDVKPPNCGVLAELWKSAKDEVDGLALRFPSPR